VNSRGARLFLTWRTYSIYDDFFLSSFFSEHLSIIDYVYYPSRFIHFVHSSYASVTSYTQSRPTHGVPYALCYVALVPNFFT